MFQGITRSGERELGEAAIRPFAATSLFLTLSTDGTIEDPVRKKGQEHGSQSGPITVAYLIEVNPTPLPFTGITGITAVGSAGTT